MHIHFFSSRQELQQAFVDAVREKDEEKVRKFILENPEEMSNQIIEENFLLHEVVEQDDECLNILQLLLSNIYDETLRVRNNQGKTALHRSVELSKQSCFEELIKKNPNLLTEVDDCGDTPLHALVWNPRNIDFHEAMKHVSRDIINKPNVELLTCVHLAAKTGNQQLLKSLLQNGGDPFVKSKSLFTPLHYAAQSGSLPNVKLLLEAVTSGNSSDEPDIAKNYSRDETEQGNTALHLAAGKGNMNVVEYLVDQLGADTVKLNKKQESPLHYSIFINNDDCFSFLLDRICPGNQSDDKFTERLRKRDYIESFRDIKGNSLFYTAIIHNNYKVIRKLLDLGYYEVAANGDGDTVLHLIASQAVDDSETYIKQYQDIYHQLLKRSGGLLFMRNKECETPLHMAAKNGNVLFIRAVHSQKLAMNVLSKNGSGLTAIHLAAQNGHALCLRELLRNGFASDFATIISISPHPLRLAAQNGYQQCVQIILEEIEVK